MQRNDAEDESHTEHHDDDGVDLESGGLVSVEFCSGLLTKFRSSSPPQNNLLSMVELLPPAPAARVELGRVLATFVARSWAARRRRAVLGPPGGVGELGRRTGSTAVAGEAGRGEPDCRTSATRNITPHLRGGVAPAGVPSCVCVSVEGGIKELVRKQMKRRTVGGSGAIRVWSLSFQELWEGLGEVWLWLGKGHIALC